VFDPGTRGPRIASGGTFSANPVSMTAGLATLEALDRDAFARLEALGERLRARLTDQLARGGVPGAVMGDASLFRFVMTADVPRTYRDTVEPAADRRLSRLFLQLLDEGVLVGANGLGCLSTPMGEREIDEIVEATARSLHALTREA
jgi:glutamate-1-semialdehyde 2,1-aminomutase